VRMEVSKEMKKTLSKVRVGSCGNDQYLGGHARESGSRGEKPDLGENKESGLKG